MKSIIVKSVLALLLIIEFYPIESNSQEITGLKNYQISNKDKELTKESFELVSTGPVEMTEVTNIEFNIFKEGSVKLCVYDAEGKLLETLVDGEMQPGNYSVHFRFKGLLPGEYYYEFEKDGLKESVRMDLTKN